MTGWLPDRLARALDGASDRERAMVAGGTLAVVLAVLYLVAWLPMKGDAERIRAALARDRATLSALQRQESATAAPAGASTIGAAPAVDARAAVLAALDARGLRSAGTQVETRDGRVAVVLEAVPFDGAVMLIDDLARSARLRVMEARLLGRVEPGTVRAEITLGR